MSIARSLGPPRRPSLVLVLVLAAAGCQKKEEGSAGAAEGAGPAASAPSAAAPRRSRRVHVERLAPAPFEERLELTATVRAANDATVSAQAPGTVQTLAPRGARVERGGLVARLDPGMLQAAAAQADAAVRLAEAGLALARDTAERQKPLAEAGIISPLEMQRLQAQLDQARAQLAQAEAARSQAARQLAFTRITAPFAGVVEDHMTEAGEQVNPGQPVARIVDTSKVKVRAGVPERFANDVAPGAALTARFNAYGVEDREARTVFVAQTIDPRSRTFDIEAELDNADGRLKPEMIARVLLTRRRQESVLTLPQNAVLRDEAGTSVFLVVEGAGGPVAELRRVELGAASEGRVVVESGLKPGDAVVVLGQSTLAAGDAVEIAPEASASR